MLRGGIASPPTDQPAPMQWMRDADTRLPAGDLWVFGYGSLMWRPGFGYQEVRKARIFGFRRALCVWSWVHRGTRQRPGLVMGLDRGGSCIGRVFRVAQADRGAVLAQLHARELATPVYLPATAEVRTEAGTVAALLFTVDRRHPQYAGRLSIAAAERVVRSAQGSSGDNVDYVTRTARHLAEAGIRDEFMQTLARRIGQQIQLHLE